MKKVSNEDNELEEIRQHYRMVIKEKREAEEKRREEEQKRIQEENERRREHDIILQTEEMRSQLEAGLEEKWRKQTKQAEEAAAAAKSKAEEAKAKAEEAEANAEEARAKIEQTRMKALKAKASASGPRKRRRQVSSTESESEETSDIGDETDTRDSEEELRRTIKRLREKREEKRTGRIKKTGKGKQAKTKTNTSENNVPTTKRGECSRARKKKRCNRDDEDDVMRNANDMGGDYKETGVRFNDCRRSPRVGGLRFGMPSEVKMSRGMSQEPRWRRVIRTWPLSASREGIIDYCLSTQKILSSKKVLILRKLCQKKGIKDTKKPEMVDALAREQVKLAYEGFEDNDEQREMSEMAEANLGEDLYEQEKRGTRSSVNTVRSVLQRWREHLSNADTDTIGSSPKLYRWMRHFGKETFLIVPLRHADEAHDRAMEKHLIRDFSPILNTCNNKTMNNGVKKSKRKGRRERRKLNRTAQKVKNLVSFSRSGTNAKRVSAMKWLEEEWKKEAKGERRMVFHGGEVWSDGWKKVKRLFGMTKVRINGQVNTMAKAKGELRQGATATIIEIVKTKTTTARYLQELRGMLKRPFEFKKLTLGNTNQLVGMYRAAVLFGDKKTKNDVRLKIDRAIRRKNGAGVRKRVVVKVRYDRRIVKNKIRAATEGVVEKRVEDMAIAKSKIQIMWRKNRTVGEIIYNHRKHANVGKQQCACRGTGLPTKGGHVLTRFSDLEGIPAFMKNAKNVTSQSQETWEEGKVATWARRFRGMVLAPIDWNQGDTAVICPVIYRHAFGKTFVWNSDYVVVREEEQRILQTARQKFEQADLQKIARWKTDDRIGQACVISKDKDLSRWRPIAPTDNDPASLAQKRVAKALQCLHYLIKMFPTEQSFYLNAIQELPGRLETTQRRFTEMGCTGVEGRCYDIKDMFTKIPHEAVRKAIWQMLLWYANRGWKQVKVSRRGKLCTISKTRKMADGYVGLQFEQLFSMVNYDLDHAYIKCGEIVTRQASEIPMGKSSSPTLATITCAMAEFNCLRGLGSDRKLVAGWRIVDDITVIVGNRGGGEEHGREDTGSLFRDLENCYDKNPSLVRKDADRDWWHFLGGTIYLMQQHRRLLYVPDTKNQASLREEERLRFQTMQDFASYSEKRSKKSTLAATLKRLWPSTSCQVLVVSSIAYALWEANLRVYAPEVSLGALAKLVKVADDQNLRRLWQVLSLTFGEKRRRREEGKGKTGVEY
ncbi:hypothetical protein CBR_g28555 [Chara braunii]|uniref:Reverse transcriptase domain-containing protein n=1 Tax=Chara braunii TaxID=69332 RepID=A0A388JW95_CHABU|nr:hypothetical protein CBR_g28555 [Chara braunii]|eukprot:GBG62079.1 hypothetical protein CBR_g28555 [Chara braunii]